MHTLKDVKTSLPASWYYDQDHYARELDAIWYRDWVCVGRMDSLESDGDYMVVRLGTQNIVVTRVTDGTVNAFHNTCRHRGSLLCRESEGRFRNGRVICPYHTWTYSLEGDLLATPGRIESADFDAADYSLYKVNVDTWRGFIFINLSESPESSLIEFLGDEVDYVQNWPLEQMRSVHQEKFPIACNWKIFWENYNECYHCPRVHPELCKVMPVYKKAVFDPADFPDWEPEFDGDTGGGAVGGGARTWTMNGEISLPMIEGLSEDEVTRGVVFASITGSMYIVGHPEYVRSVRILPTGPESVELTVDWLLPSAFEVDDEQDIQSIIELPRLVIQQDGEACELNQLGLHSDRYDSGILVPQEYELWHFHEFVRRKLAAASAASAVEK